jgi:hypothetical protein
MEDVVNETLLAYLLGPAVMLLVGVALWAAAHHEKNGRHKRSAGAARWLDTHYVDLMHHRH